MSTYERRRFFCSDDAIRVLGEDIAKKEAKRLRKEFSRLRENVPSEPWAEAKDEFGREFPPGRQDPRTPHGIRMVVSMVSGRYTPPISLDSEDALDGKTEGEANAYLHPASPSADVIRYIRDHELKAVARKRPRRRGYKPKNLQAASR